MEELLIRGLVIGGVFAIIAYVAHLAWKIARSPGEGARRLRLVIKVLVALFLAAALYDGFGIAGPAVGAAALGAFIWIRRGSKSPTL